VVVVAATDVVVGEVTLEVVAGVTVPCVAIGDPSRVQDGATSSSAVTSKAERLGVVIVGL
jgi:hypothetical protein